MFNVWHKPSMTLKTLCPWAFFVVSFENDVIVTITTVCVSTNALGSCAVADAEVHEGLGFVSEVYDCVQKFI